ncbi:hypothetical protein K438DRAFT_378463 [Mycena galopus ATCC 62051]|nr:hypothetical protein K438DRAFT_378463 [Mycena galopus ATCC 62051]
MAPPVGVSCADCGLDFQYLEPPRTICFKCEKLERCNGNETEMAVVDKLKQCSGCSLVYKFLPSDRTQCGKCDQRDAKLLKSSKDKDKENISKKEPKAKATPPDDVIDLANDSDDSEASVKEMPGEIEDLKAQLAKYKKVASSVRLTRKVKSETEEVPSRTSNLLKLRENSRTRPDVSKAMQLLFKITVSLQKPAGQKVGTCVPVQSRGFMLNETMGHVFRTMVAMVQEPEGRWAGLYPGKSFTRDDVHFTFTGGMDIPAKFRGDSPVASFWNAFTKQENQYFKKSAIANGIAEIVMLVPIELTLDPPEPSSDSDDDFDAILGTNKRRKSSSSKKSHTNKRLKVKTEDTDFSMTIKPEPMDTDLTTIGSNIRRKKDPKPLPSLRITSPVEFTKEVLTNLLKPITSAEEFHGVRDVVVKYTPSLRSHFQLSSGDEHYLARRLESDSFRFNPELELEAARGELNRGQQLKTLLKMLIKTFGIAVPELAAYSTPDLFIATVCAQNTILGHLVCQTKPDIPFNKVVEPELDILNAISHYSLIQNKGMQFLIKFKGWLIWNLLKLTNTHQLHVPMAPRAFLHL